MISISIVLQQSSLSYVLFAQYSSNLTAGFPVIYQWWFISYSRKSMKTYVFWTITLHVSYCANLNSIIHPSTVLHQMYNKTINIALRIRGGQSVIRPVTFIHVRAYWYLSTLSLRHSACLYRWLLCAVFPLRSIPPFRTYRLAFRAVWTCTCPLSIKSHVAT